MSPSDASVYSDTWSATTWVLFLTGMIIFVTTLMLTLIALVHRSCQEVATAGADAVAEPAGLPERTVRSVPAAEPARNRDSSHQWGRRTA